MIRRGWEAPIQGKRKGSGEVPISLTIVYKYPGVLNEEARGPELPSPRSAAPRSGAVLHLRKASAQALPRGPSPPS